MKAIVAVDQNWGIGCGGQLLQPIPEDLKFFKEKTLNNVIVMGRETFDSLPGKRPLKDRINIVLTKNQAFQDERLVICHSIEETLEYLKSYNHDEIFIIGGASIYEQFLPLCDEVYVTKIENSYSADKYFPNLDELDGWKLIQTGEMKEFEGVGFCFTTYKNLKRG